MEDESLASLVRPTVKISSVGEDTEFWKAVEKRFATHDFTKPLWKAELEDQETER